MTKQRSTESYAMGQSGYTAGRIEGDRALEQDIEARNLTFPRDGEQELRAPSVDDRWESRGGPAWPPLDEPAADSSAADTDRGRD